MNVNANGKTRIDYRHYICWAIMLAFVLCGVLRFSGAFVRIIEACKDFGMSLGYYFCELFGIPHYITPTVNELSKLPLETFLPESWLDFRANWVRYWRLWATMKNFKGYLSYLADLLYHAAKKFLKFRKKFYKNA